MIVGVPKEIKNNEYRVSITPGGADALVLAGHRVLVETGAGIGSGYGDEDYARVGAEIVPSHAAAFEQAQMVVKVKEPVREEYPLLREGLVLFTFLHLAADEQLTRILVENKVAAIAYETVELPDGSLPLLAPMSEIAGRISVQVAAHYLEKVNGGRGKLMGGVPGVAPANVVVLGAGSVGSNAAKVALGMGARVILLNRSMDKLRFLSEVLHGDLTTLAATRYNIAQSLVGADVLIGGVLVTGSRAPVLVTGDMVRSMGPGAIVVDVAIDQSGCIETIRPTTHSDPVYLVDDVIHYAVTNMPGAVPGTSTAALTNVTLPYALALANLGFARAVSQDPSLARGVNTYAGHLTYRAVAEAFGLAYEPLNI